MVNEQTQHMTGADLVRFLDGEDPSELHARNEAHLAACDACAGDFATLRDESRRVSDWLRRYDGEIAGAGGGGAAAPAAARSTAPTPIRAARPRRSALPPWLKAAAAILLVAVPAVAVPGVREWVVERVGTGPGEPASGPEAVMATAPEARLVRFVPAPGPFTVRFDAPEVGAALVLGRASEADGTAGPASGDGVPGPAAVGSGEAVLELEGAAEPVVSAGSIRVMNRPDGAGRYVLRLPVATTAVRVMVGGREVTVDGAGLDRGAVVPLGAR